MATRAAKLALRGKALSDTGTEIGIVNNADATAITIDASENVGIGESSPLGKLHVKTADSGATVDASANELVIEGSGNAGMSILTGASSTGSIYFGDSGTNWDGYITYSQATRSMTLGVAAGGGSVNINAAGNVGIGVVPEGHHNTHSALQVGGNGVWTSYKPQGASGEMDFQHNAYYSQAHGGDRYISTDEATKYRQVSGAHQWYTAASGSADAAISWQYGMQINNDGIVTMPLQPFFYAKNTGTGSQAGDGITTNPPLFPTAVQDIGSCLNAAHNRFTAPVAGRYFFSGVPAYKQTGQDYAVRLVLNGTDLTDVIRLIGSPNSHSGVSFSVFLYLNTNDYIELNMQASGSNGYHRNNSSVPNWWSGGLL